MLLLRAVLRQGIRRRVQQPHRLLPLLAPGRDPGRRGCRRVRVHHRRHRDRNGRVRIITRRAPDGWIHRHHRGEGCRRAGARRARGGGGRVHQLSLRGAHPAHVRGRHGALRRRLLLRADGHGGAMRVLVRVHEPGGGAGDARVGRGPELHGVDDGVRDVLRRCDGWSRGCGGCERAGQAEEGDERGEEEGALM